MHVEFMILKSLADKILYYPSTKILQSHLEELGENESKY